MKTFTLSLLAAAGLCFCGCATRPAFTGPVAAAGGEAVVYVYYTPVALIPKPGQDVYVNGAKIIRLTTGGYYIYHAQPGFLLFTNTPEAPTGGERKKAIRENIILPLTVDGGQVYYVEQVYIAGIPKGSGSFLLRDRSVALEVIRDSNEMGSAVPAAAAPAPEQPAVKADVVRAMAVVAPKKHYDSIMTADGDVVAATDEERAETDGLIAFLKAQKDSRDFDQIAKIEFVSASEAKVGFIWYGGKHVGTLTVVKESGAWKITAESHSI